MTTDLTRPRPPFPYDLLPPLPSFTLGSDDFAEGERIEAQLIFINRTKRVAQFSRKAVLPDPWSVPIAEGDVAEAKVVEATASEVRFDVGGRLGVCSRETARTFVAGACGDVQPGDGLTVEVGDGRILAQVTGTEQEERHGSIENL